jgi:hypothetical protein
MGITCICGICGKSWQSMAGSPTFNVAKYDVCAECALTDGGFCPACLSKPCRGGVSCSNEDLKEFLLNAQRAQLRRGL